MGIFWSNGNRIYYRSLLGGENMRPIIGLSAHYENRKLQVNRDYHDAVVRAGGVPVVLPLTTERECLLELAERLDGLILTGGYDMDPHLFGEEPSIRLGQVSPERDQFELEFLSVFYPSNKPIFAICRGIQVLNVFLGGTLYQDIASEVDRPIQHSQKAPRDHGAHWIEITHDSLLHQVLGREKIRVNSYHHQALKQLADPLSVSAVSSDGIIEAVEGKDAKRFILGVQWHPEAMAAKDPHEHKLFKNFIENCLYR